MSNATTGLPRSRVFQLTQAPASCGFTRKYIINFSDYNKFNANSLLFINLPALPAHCAVVNAALYCRQAFAPGSFGWTQIILQDPVSSQTIWEWANSGDIPAVGQVSFQPASGADPIALTNALPQLKMNTGSSNLNTLTAGEFQLFLSVLDLDLVS